jgi:hypothetical protein
MDKTQFKVSSGFLEDEKCIVLASILETEVLRSLKRCKQQSADRSQMYGLCVQQMFQRLARWGVAEDSLLSKSMIKQHPGVDVYMRYTLLSFVKSLSRDLEDDNRVEYTVPSIGTFTHQVMSEMGLRPETQGEVLLTDGLQRKIAVQDCIRSALLNYVQIYEVDSGTMYRPAQDDVDDVRPEDSVSQVMANQPALAPANEVRAPSTVARSVPVAQKFHDSDFKKRVAQKIQSYSGQQPTAQSSEGPKSDVSTQSHSAQEHVASGNPIVY